MISKKKIHQDHSGPPQLDPLVYMKKQKQKKNKNKNKNKNAIVKDRAGSKYCGA